MSDFAFYRDLMRHDAPRKHRRVSRPSALSVTPPKCDTCRRQLHPEISHSECEVS